MTLLGQRGIIRSEDVSLDGQDPPCQKQTPPARELARTPQGSSGLFVAGWSLPQTSPRIQLSPKDPGGRGWACREGKWEGPAALLNRPLPASEG